MDSPEYNSCLAAIRACRLENPVRYGMMTQYFDPVRLYDEVRCVYGYDLYLQCLYAATKECEAEEGALNNAQQTA